MGTGTLSHLPLGPLLPLLPHGPCQRLLMAPEENGAMVCSLDGPESSAPAFPLCFSSGWFLLSHHTLGSIQPADHALLLETLQALPSPRLLHLQSISLEGLRSSRWLDNARKLRPQGLSPLLPTPPHRLAIPALWLCQHHGTPWGLGFLPYKKGVAISASSTPPEANARMQGAIEGGWERAVGSITLYCSQVVC